MCLLSCIARARILDMIINLKPRNLQWTNAKEIPGCLQVINDKFGVTKQQIRTYIHYHLSHYHHHVHFIHVSVNMGAGMAAGKAHLLDSSMPLATMFSICLTRLKHHCTALVDHDFIFQFHDESAGCNCSEKTKRFRHVSYEVHLTPNPVLFQHSCRMTPNSTGSVFAQHEIWPYSSQPDQHMQQISDASFFFICTQNNSALPYPHACSTSFSCLCCSLCCMWPCSIS